jgi:hypothetical protein
MLPSYGSPQFYVNYTIQYRVPATNQSGTVQTVAYCQ